MTEIYVLIRISQYVKISRANNGLIREGSYSLFKEIFAGEKNYSGFYAVKARKIPLNMQKNQWPSVGFKEKLGFDALTYVSTLT